ncbi:hypothetical protein BH09BAC5_BH09BAC5_07730 [soil metagenome]
MAMYGLPLCIAIVYKIRTNIKFKHKMITENEVSDILGEELPEINNELEKLSNLSNIYKTMQCFADYTKQLIRKGNLKEVKHCFLVAEKILKNGNGTVKNAVENCYLYSVSTIIDIASPMNQAVKKLLTSSLKKEYDRQIFASGM